MAGLLALPVVLLTAHGPATSATPSAGKTAHGRAPAAKTAPRPPKIPGLSISVSDGRTTVQAGDQLTYTVRVRNSGTTRAPGLKITQTLPRGLKFISASRPGTVAAGQVIWYAVLPAGGTATFSVVARLTRAPAGTLRLAAVACATAQGSSRPMVCAAHLDRLPAGAAAAAGSRQAAAPSSRAPLMFGVALVAVLVAGALAVGARRRGRVRRGLRRSS